MNDLMKGIVHVLCEYNIEPVNVESNSDNVCFTDLNTGQDFILQLSAVPANDLDSELPDINSNKEFHISGLT